MGNSAALEAEKARSPAYVSKAAMRQGPGFDLPGHDPGNSGGSTLHDFGSARLGSAIAADDKVSQACLVATARTCPFGGACHTCPTRVQPKLEVGQADDEHEREADEVADKVMRMSEPCCSGRPDEDSRGKIRLKAWLSAPVGIEVSPEVEAQIQSLRNSGGRPLSDSERTFFEPRFGRGFADVRLHESAPAIEASGAIRARAFTIGQDVVSRGELARGDQTSRRLMAHELAHTIQQSREMGSGLPRDAALQRQRTDASFGILPEGWEGGVYRPRKEQGDATGPIEVTVIDDSSVTGWLAAFTRTGEIYMSDVSSMVYNVLTAVGDRKLARLNILDHGNEEGIEIGDTWIDLGTLPEYASTLSRLKGHFAPGGFVHLQHCNAGQNLDLLMALANTFGVTVYAGTGAHNPIYRINFGRYVRCHPGGACDMDVGRP